ncbi:unnamed protein product, partial [Didymodactylos carnosus]
MLEKYFNALSILSFDKAKEILDKEKDIRSGYLVWTKLIEYLYQIIQLEKGYHNLGFSVTKWGTKKDKTLIAAYSELQTDIHVQIEVEHNHSQGSSSSNEITQFKLLKDGLHQFLNIRVKLLRLHEIETLSLLLNVHYFICEYQYLNALSNLHQMQATLKEWNDKVENEAKLFVPARKPALITWFSKTHEFLVAKFSIYFFDYLQLYGGCILSDMKIFLSKTNPDFYSKISQFQRKTNCEWITIALQTDQQLQTYH